MCRVLVVARQMLFSRDVRTLAVACGIQFPDQGLNLSTLHWELGGEDHQGSLGIQNLGKHLDKEKLEIKTTPQSHFPAVWFIPAPSLFCLCSSIFFFFTKMKSHCIIFCRPTFSLTTITSFYFNRSLLMGCFQFSLIRTL